MGLRRDCSTLNCPRVRQAHRLPTCAFCSLLSNFRLFRLWWGQNRPAGRREFAGRVEARRRAPGAGEYERAGWCWGSDEFRHELLAHVSEQGGPKPTGEDIRPSAQAKAERMLQEELARRW